MITIIHIVDDQDVRRPFLGEADEHFQNEHESNNGGDSAGEGFANNTIDYFSVSKTSGWV